MCWKTIPGSQNSKDLGLTVVGTMALARTHDDPGSFNGGVYKSPSGSWLSLVVLHASGLTMCRGDGEEEDTVS